MNSIKKNWLTFGLLILVFLALTSAANAQFYPPIVPPFYGYTYGYSPVSPAFGYYPPVSSATVAPYGYRGAHALLTTLALLGALPTTTTTSTLLPTTSTTSTLLPTYTVPTTSYPTTTSTIGTTTALLLGGSISPTTALLLSSTTPTTTYPTTTSTIGTTTALLLGGVSTTTLLALGI
ncbi:MAG: hypothetical protein K6U11_09610 [bacterium]|nr:hypothetical protein [bacterium]